MTNESGNIISAQRCAQKEVADMMDKIALFLLIIGGLNWGLVGIFEFDLVAFLFGSSTSLISRIIYIVIAASALWCISLYFKNHSLVKAED